MSAPLVLLPARIDDRLTMPGGRPLYLHGRSMGTGWSVRTYLPTVAGTEMAERLQGELQARLDELDLRQMSHWTAASEIGRYNRLPAGQWQSLSADTWSVLQSACAHAERSDGALDPTIGALVDLWGFGPAGQRSTPPTATEVSETHALGGWCRLRLDAAGRRVLQPGGLRLDLSCIAKGHAVDVLADLLADRWALPHHLVEVGGELRGSGFKADGQPWWVDLEPLGSSGAAVPQPAATRLRIALHGLAVATSGDSQRYFDHQGRRYAHTLDPRSGMPIRQAPAAVTVLHAKAREADAWATVLNVLGAQAGLALAERHGIAALFALRDGQAPQGVRMSASSPAQVLIDA